MYSLQISTLLKLIVVLLCLVQFRFVQVFCNWLKCIYIFFFYIFISPLNDTIVLRKMCTVFCSIFGLHDCPYFKKNTKTQRHKQSLLYSCPLFCPFCPILSHSSWSRSLLLPCLLFCAPLFITVWRLKEILLWGAGLERGDRGSHMDRVGRTRG